MGCGGIVPVFTLDNCHNYMSSYMENELSMPTYGLSWETRRIKSDSLKSISIVHTIDGSRGRARRTPLPKGPDSFISTHKIFEI